MFPGITEREQFVLVALRVSHPEVESRHQPAGEEVPNRRRPTHAPARASLAHHSGAAIVDRVGLS